MRAPYLRRSVRRRLESAGCVAADDEAEQIVGRAVDRATVAAWLERRSRGEPLAWILGTMDFCGRELTVAPGVYVPRTQTEELARRAARMLPEGGHSADLCCGSGAVAAHLLAEVPGASVVGTDVDRRAAACARRNGVPTVVCDVAAGLRSGRFDLVTAVAPYVPSGSIQYLPSDVQRFEPARALDGGPDGLDVVLRVVGAAGRLLRPGGRLVLELGGDQDVALAGSLAGAGLAQVAAWRDEDGDLRGLEARRTSDVSF